jgi:hypothetical protein
VKKPDVIQKNELYFCNQGSNVIQNQLSKSKHRLKSFVLQACVILKVQFFQFVSVIQMYCKNVLDVDCQTQGRLKLMTGLYFSEKSVINSRYLVSAPSYFSW